MTDDDTPRVGDAVRWDMAWKVRLVDDPLWCLVVECLGDDDVGRTEFEDVALCGGSAVRNRVEIGDRERFKWPIAAPNHAEAVVVPPEDWPDEVCAAVAKWRLSQ